MSGVATRWGGADVSGGHASGPMTARAMTAAETVCSAGEVANNTAERLGKEITGVIEMAREVERRLLGVSPEPPRNTNGGGTPIDKPEVGFMSLLERLFRHQAAHNQATSAAVDELRMVLQRVLDNFPG